MKDKIKRFDEKPKEVTVTISKGDYVTKNIDGVVVQIFVNKIHTSTVECFVNELHTPKPGKIEEYSIISWLKMYNRGKTV